MLDWPPVLVHTELIAIERGQLYLASELPGAAGGRRRPFRGAKAVDAAAAATLLPQAAAASRRGGGAGRGRDVGRRPARW